MKEELVVKLTLLVVTRSIPVIAIESASWSDQLAARSEKNSFNETPFARPTILSAATGGWLLVKASLSEPLWIRKEPPARSLLKAEVSMAKAAGLKLVTLSVVE